MKASRESALMSVEVVIVVCFPLSVSVGDNYEIDPIPDGKSSVRFVDMVGDGKIVEGALAILRSKYDIVEDAIIGDDVGQVAEVRHGRLTSDDDLTFEQGAVMITTTIDIDVDYPTMKEDRGVSHQGIMRCYRLSLDNLTIGGTISDSERGVGQSSKDGESGESFHRVSYRLGSRSDGIIGSDGTSSTRCADE